MDMVMMTAWCTLSPYHYRHHHHHNYNMFTLAIKQETTLITTKTSLVTQDILTAITN